MLLIGAPLYNYSLPSSLKAWIDHIHVPGVTAPFDVPTQPLAGRPAVIVSAQGAAYDAHSPTEGWDHAVPVLELILGTSLGMTLTVITTSLTLAETVPALADQLDRSRADWPAPTTTPPPPPTGWRHLASSSPSPDARASRGRPSTLPAARRARGSLAVRRIAPCGRPSRASCGRPPPALLSPPPPRFLCYPRVPCPARAAPGTVCRPGPVCRLGARTR